MHFNLFENLCKTLKKNFFILTIKISNQQQKNNIVMYKQGIEPRPWLKKGVNCVVTPDYKT